MKPIRTIACVSDLHCGTYYGLCVKGIVSDEGNEFALNSGQELMLEYWNEYIEFTHQEEVDTVLYMGDLVHGQNPKSRGIQMMTTDMDIQQKMGFETIKAMAEGRRNFFVSGSGYHSEPVPGVKAERNICNEIGKLEGTQSEWWGPYAFVAFEPSEEVFLIQHGESQAFIYREMLLGRENIHMNAAAALKKIPFTRVVMKGHWHCTEIIKVNKQLIVQNPCFCMFIPWRGTLRLIPKFQPDIGGTIIKIYEDGTIEATEKTFEPVPKVEAQELKVR